MESSMMTPVAQDGTVVPKGIDILCVKKGGCHEVGMPEKAFLVM
jgi:hypothetical protein